MKSFYETTDFKTLDEIKTFFKHAITYRNGHRDESAKIAHFVFDATHQSRISIALPHDFERIRIEFGALEAPGLPEDGSDTDVFDDRLWAQLDFMITKLDKG